MLRWGVYELDDETLSIAIVTACGLVRDDDRGCSRTAYSRNDHNSTGVARLRHGSITIAPGEVGLHDPSTGSFGVGGAIRSAAAIVESRGGARHLMAPTNWYARSSQSVFHASRCEFRVVED